MTKSKAAKMTARLRLMWIPPPPFPMSVAPLQLIRRILKRALLSNSVQSHIKRMSRILAGKMLFQME